jgi:hypothetical protein
MANQSIIEHMLNVLDQYEAKTLQANQVDAFFDQYAQVLEGISPQALSLVRQTCRLLVKFNEEALGDVSATVVLETLRKQVRSLHDGAPNLDIQVRQPARGQ